MILLMLVTAVPASPDGDMALRLCRPALARQAGGEIQTISPTLTRTTSHGSIVEGELTATVGMGPPPAGSASAHHLIRTDFHFRCRTAHGRVREATVTPRQ
jgi:hypothetical protein